jgi:hypothetical protein
MENGYAGHTNLLREFYPGQLMLRDVDHRLQACLPQVHGSET